MKILENMNIFKKKIDLDKLDGKLYPNYKLVSSGGDYSLVLCSFDDPELIKFYKEVAEYLNGVDNPNERARGLMNFVYKKINPKKT